jgi:hypothetical protein
MAEQVKVLDRKGANIVLFNAMAEIADSTILEVFKVKAEGDDTEVSVQVLVNGVEVPFAECLVKAVNKMCADNDELVKEKAIDLITRSGLRETLDTLENADWQIQEALDKGFEPNLVAMQERIDHLTSTIYSISWHLTAKLVQVPNEVNTLLKESGVKL